MSLPVKEAPEPCLFCGDRQCPLALGEVAVVAEQITGALKFARPDAENVVGWATVAASITAREAAERLCEANLDPGDWKGAALRLASEVRRLRRSVEAAFREGQNQPHRSWHESTVRAELAGVSDDVVKVLDATR